MPNRRLNVVARRGLAAATSGLILAGALMPAATAAAGAPPVLRSDYINTLKNVTTTGNVLANDKDPSGGGLVFDSFTPVSVSVGTLTIASNGAYSFSPATNWTGTASTTYQAHNTNRSRTGNIYITVRTENAAPVANDDVLTLGEDSTTDVTADILANDTDVDGDTLWVTGVSGAVGGTVDLTTEIVTFTASADLCGSSAAGFDYTITDGFLTAATGHVTVDITCANDDPTAVDDDASGTEDTNVTITASDLAADDTDPDTADALTVTAVSNPSGGTVSLVAGTITFVPTANLCGSDAASFDYTVDDGNGGTDTGTVTIDLTCVNDGPAAGDDTVSVAEDSATNVTGTLLDNDSDLDDDTLAVSAVSNATGGSVVLVGDVVTFTPSANLCGTGAGGFDYTLSDGTTTDSGHVTVDITCANDDPTAVDDDASGTEDTNVTITASDLAADDTDPDTADALTVTAVSNPSGGTVSLVAGTITFVPTANLCGSDAASFDYTVDDGNGGTDTGTVTIDLTCVNDAPNAVNDTASVDMNSPAAAHNVLANDTDVDNVSLTIQSAVVDAAKGTASVVAGKVQFTPATNVSGQAVITYTITDGTNTDTATLTITVGADVTGPVVVRPSVAFGSGRVDETAPIKVSWSATDVPAGVAKYEVQQSVAGGAFKALYTGTAKSITRFYAFKQLLVFRVRAQDTVGNWSGWVTSSARKIVAFQNSSKYVAYSGTWTKVTSAKSSGAGYAYTTTKDKKARLTFTGRSVLYVAPKSPSSGKVKVYVDGTLLGTFNLNRSSLLRGRIIARKSWSASGTHTIRIVAVNNGKRTSLDAFVVLK